MNKKFFGSFYRVKNTLHAFRKISARYGVLGLWKGWLPNVQRAAIVNLGGRSCWVGIRRYFALVGKAIGLFKVPEFKT